MTARLTTDMRLDIVIDVIHDDMTHTTEYARYPADRSQTASQIGKFIRDAARQALQDFAGEEVPPALDLTIGIDAPAYGRGQDDN